MSSEGIFFTELFLLVSDKIFHVKQTLLFYSVYYILFFCFLESATKSFQVESKNNKQSKKMASFSPFISNVDVTS